VGYEFNGDTRIIQLTPGTTTLDVRGLYSSWKSWMSSGGSKYDAVFSVVGGDPVNESAGIYITSYFYLLNGWKIRPQEGNHTLNVTNGVLLSSDGSSPFVQTQGYYNVMILSSLPIKSETINIAGGGGGGATASEIWSYPNKMISLPPVFETICNYMSSQTTTMSQGQFPMIQSHLLNISSQLVTGIKTNVDWTKLNKVPRAL